MERCQNINVAKILPNVIEVVTLLHYKYPHRTSAMIQVNDGGLLRLLCTSMYIYIMFCDQQLSVVLDARALSNERRGSGESTVVDPVNDRRTISCSYARIPMIKIALVSINFNCMFKLSYTRHRSIKHDH